MAAVYVIGPESDPKLVKVGWTTRPERRLALLQIGSPVKLVLHGTVADLSQEAARALEAWTHRVLADAAMHGEWFAVSPEVALVMVRRGLETIGSQWRQPRRPVRDPLPWPVEDPGVAEDRELSRRIALLGKGQWAAQADL